MDLEDRALAAFEAAEAGDIKTEEKTDVDAGTDEDSAGDAGDGDGAKKDESDGAKDSDKVSGEDDKKTTDDDSEEDEDDEDDIDEAVEEAKTKVEELPPINQYIYKNLPEIATTGLIDGKEVTIKVKTANEIPDGFDWKSKRDEKMFDQALIDQGVKANNLANEYEAKQKTAEGDKYRQAEANDIQSDLRALQTEGLIPKFSTDTANTNPDHPGVKLANEVLALYTKLNGERPTAGHKDQPEGRNTL